MEIYNDIECRNKIISGINKLGKTVCATYGPNGQRVIIPNKYKYGEYIVTKDGVSVAESIVLSDPIENIGANFVKEAAKLTVAIAGDGTTTATLLAMTLINTLKSFKYKEVEKALDIYIPLVISKLKQQSMNLDEDSIIKVAMISSNSDEVISKMIVNAYKHTSNIIIRQSSMSDDDLELIDGVQLNTSYMSPNYIVDRETDIITLKNPLVLIVDGKLEDRKSIENMLKYVVKSDKSLLIIADELNQDISRFLEANVMNGALKCAVIKSPGFSQHRKNLLKDISIVTGGNVFKYPVSLSDFKYTVDNPSLFENFGTVKEVTITPATTTITPFTDIYKTEEFKTHLGYLKALYSTSLKTSKGGDLDLIQQRLDLLTGKLAVISVGGRSEHQMIERYDRYDDAVRAVLCAIRGGVSVGAGVYLNNIAEEIKNVLVNNKELDNQVVLTIRGALGAPYSILEGDKIINTYKIKTILDPTSVIIAALENATAVVKTVLSTGAVVLNKSEWREH